jgi:hypothetical protein
MFEVLSLEYLSDHVFGVFLFENRAVNEFMTNSCSGKTLRHRLLETPHINSNSFHISNCFLLIDQSLRY